MRVLVVEDDPRMADVIRRSLTREGFAVDVSYDGDDALMKASVVEYDAIVLDVMLPGRSGLDVCQIMRERGVWSPVLILTARDAVSDRVAGLDRGADDYLVKPFALAELLARLRSLTRRGRPDRPTILSVGDLTLNPATRKVHRGEEQIELSAKEFALLEALMRRCGDVLTRLALIEQAWDIAYETRSNVVDVYMRRLRLKIDVPFGLSTLETVRGVGYRLNAPA
jgi:two-component system, OmpR family, response regulator